MFKSLNDISVPHDIKQLNINELNKLCKELRKEIIDKVSETGGHIASNMGSIELTVALHYVFNSPIDSIVWDVGHQCYAHKILTGRNLRGIRTESGISGFPKSAESVHDSFVAGHASTSISAALGIAEAKKLQNDSSYTIAVIGDGAMSGGMAIEALNNAGRSKSKLIIILNDNEMSISKNVGAMSKYLTEIRNQDLYFKFKDKTEDIIKSFPLIGNPMYKNIKKIKTYYKDIIYNSNSFENLGFTYLGPADGHDIELLIRILNRAKNLNSPVFVHIKTIKGKGYKPAEDNPSLFHGIGPFDKNTGKVNKQNGKSYSSEFGDILCDLAKNNKKICAITAAMTDGTGLNKFAKNYPDRFYDVGIAEEHALTFAAGLSKGGMIPVFAVYSTFLQRAYDQAIHDASIESKHVILAIDRAGIVGGDGETHQGIFDVSFLTTIPKIEIYSPFTFNELKYDLETAVNSNGLVAVRYPRDNEYDNCEIDELKDYSLINKSNNTLIVCYGRLFNNAINASKVTNSSILKLNKIWPLNEEAVNATLKFNNIIFIEESVKPGSIAEHFTVELVNKNYKGNIIIRCVEGFLSHMSINSGMKISKLDTDSIINTIQEMEENERKK